MSNMELRCLLLLVVVSVGIIMTSAKPSESMSTSAPCLTADNVLLLDGSNVTFKVVMQYIPDLNAINFQISVKQLELTCVHITVQKNNNLEFSNMMELQYISGKFIPFLDYQSISEEVSHNPPYKGIYRLITTGEHPVFQLVRDDAFWRRKVLTQTFRVAHLNQCAALADCRSIHFKN
eukprot:TRINITY_DN1740_c0_g1_i1.p1 TRINITY_DN1740_c0_g1~~TRINITY_DN1740_c0_g1_i1.p1  ORF type:complete len:178 (-),score=32.74 TRINITY_DN1740_c0_g1_i1:73-606(-)